MRAACARLGASQRLSTVCRSPLWCRLWVRQLKSLIVMRVEAVTVDGMNRFTRLRPRPFSHGPLLFWLLTTIFLALMILVAVIAGSGSDPDPVDEVHVAGIDADAVYTFRAELIVLPSMTANPRPVTDWATYLAQFAHREAAETGNDTMTVMWTEAAEAAERLAGADHTDNNTFRAATHNLALAGDRLALAAHGADLSPSPPLLDTAGWYGSTFTLPQRPTVTLPPQPTLPTPAPFPALPTQLPFPSLSDSQ